MSELLLGVNIDHIATLRNARGTSWPDPVQAAFIAEQAGADCITVHIREDQRHIKDRDVKILRETIQTKMNLEMAVTEKMINLACHLKPHSCCLVPENRQELTTEGGIDVASQINKMRQAVNRLNDAGIQVAFFIKANENQINATADAGGTHVEIHTGSYATSTNERVRENKLTGIRQSIEFAVKLGLKVNAGHGLDYHNVKPIASISNIQGLNIGHAIISRAVIVGLANAVKSMKYIMNEARQK